MFNKTYEEGPELIFAADRTDREPIDFDVRVSTEDMDQWIQAAETAIQNIKDTRARRLKEAEEIFLAGTLAGTISPGSGKDFEDYLKHNQSSFTTYARMHGMYAYAAKLKALEQFKKTTDLVKKLGGSISIPQPVQQAIRICSDQAMIDKLDALFQKQCKANSQSQDPIYFGGAAQLNSSAASYMANNKPFRI